MDCGRARVHAIARALAEVPPTTSTTTTSTTTSSTTTTTTGTSSTSSTTATSTTTTSLTTTSSHSTTTSTTSTTSSSTTTTTTAPVPEICGNCIDDDGNGLTDLDDPACCGGSLGTLTVKPLLRIIAKDGGRSYFQLGGVTNLTTPATLSGDVAVQMSQPAAGTILCARVPAAAFGHRQKSFRFDDRKGLVSSAKGIRRAMLAPLPGGGTRVRARGKLVTFETPAHAGTARVAIGFTGPDGPRCATGDVTLRGPRDARLRAP